MGKGDLYSVVFLCIINVIFMVAGMFLNYVVIISLWRSRQLRNKLFYFMILVLSCFDLAVVASTHPLLIASAICFSLEEVNDTHEDIRLSVSIVLCGSSMSALMLLNVERFVALACLYFHQASVTKARLVCLFAFLSIIIVSSSALYYFNMYTITNVLIALFLSMLLLLFIIFNYTMFTIAKSKQADEKFASITAASWTVGARKTRILNLKNISTCSLAVCCFLVCSCPQIYSALRLTSETSLYDRQALLFSLWSNTFLSINSTFNCVIFFWRNSILRREGTKIINALRVRVIK